MNLWIACTGVVLISLYLYRADFQQYSLFTVGVFRRVHRYRAQDQRTECTETGCDSGVLEGEIRKATKEVVLFGCPVLRHNTVVNHYCPEHTSFEYQQGNFSVTRTERVKQTLLTGVTAFADWKVNEQHEESAFDNAASDVSTAFSLASIAFVIVIVAVLIIPLKGLRGET